MRVAHLALALSALVVQVTGAENADSRAAAQQREADAILLFDGPDSLHFERPDKHSDPFPLTELADRVSTLATQRAMIVVIMGKPTQMWPKDKFKNTVDDLEARLRKFGFKQVVFHLASAFSPTIYRE